MYFGEFKVPTQLFGVSFLVIMDKGTIFLFYIYI